MGPGTDTVDNNTTYSYPFFFSYKSFIQNTYECAYIRSSRTFSTLVLSTFYFIKFFFVNLYVYFMLFCKTQIYKTRCFLFAKNLPIIRWLSAQ